MQVQQPKEGYKFIKSEFGKEMAIPFNWIVNKLEDVSDILDSQRVPLEESDRAKREGSIPYYGASGVIDYIDDFIFNERLVCLAEDGENLRSRVLPIAFGIEGKAWVNNHAHVLRPNNRVIDPKYLENFLNQIKYEKYLTFTAQPKLTQDMMKKIPITLPSMKEQIKIASILSKVDELIQKTGQIIEQTQRLKKGLMQRLLTKGIGHTKFKETAIGRIPEEWSISRLDALCKVERGKFTYRPRNDPAFYDGKYPFIQTGDIEKSNIYIKHFSQTLNEKGLSVSKIFPSGIIAITIAANIGSVAITTFPVCFPDSIVAIAPHKIDLLFLYYYLKIRKQYLEMSATVNAQPNINLETLRPLQIPVPSTDEQHEIAVILSKTDNIIQSEQSYKSLLGQLKIGLIQQLLTGKIRVKT